MTKSDLKSLIKECIDEMYKPESFGRNPFNIKKFVLLYKDADGLFKSIDFQEPKNEPIKTAEGEFTESQYILNDLVKAIQKKDKSGIVDSVNKLDKILKDSQSMGKKISPERLSGYNNFKRYLGFN